MFVVLGGGDCVLGVETVETLTTLGAISSLCKTKNQYTAALAILPGLVNVAESDNTDGDFLRICASKTEAEHQWWNELLLWDQHGNWLG